ncbi:MAG TPA: GPR endopeptidase [Clostridiales bacterium]|nr:GPR endopeptidase [Clostridiales bacterium]
MKNIRTDLAIEARELYSTDGGQIPGVTTENEEIDGINIDRVHVLSSIGEQRIGKPVGNYVTLESMYIRERDPEFEEKLSFRLSQEIRNLVSIDKNTSVLIVGLGNWNITPDSLGPKVVDRIMVTRHLLELIPDKVDERVHSVCAISPGVLGITGIETGEIIRGVIEKIRPDVVIAIDALASRRTSRIGVTIQLADTGISPGSGIGNKRMALTKETLGADTIAIGVPTVVYAHTIGRDTIKLIHDSNIQIGSDINFMSEEQLDAMLNQILSENMGDLVVTPKDVDIMIDNIAGIIADGINLAVHDNITLDEIRTFLH